MNMADSDQYPFQTQLFAFKKIMLVTLDVCCQYLAQKSVRYLYEIWLRHWDMKA